VDGPAYVAAAVRAACMAKAPRRTVQAVAAAVAGVFAHLTTACAANATKVKPQPATVPAHAGHAHDEAAHADAVEALRSARRVRRNGKKNRRKISKAAALALAAAAAVATTDTSVGVLALQCETVRALATIDNAVSGDGREEALDVKLPKRRKKCGGTIGRLEGDDPGDELMDDGGDDPGGEFLDDLWADEGMQQVKVVDTAALRAEGMKRRASLLLDLNERPSQVSSGGPEQGPPVTMCPEQGTSVSNQTTNGKPINVGVRPTQGAASEAAKDPGIAANRISRLRQREMILELHASELPCGTKLAVLRACVADGTFAVPLTMPEEADDDACATAVRSMIELAGAPAEYCLDGDGAAVGRPHHKKKGKSRPLKP
jgi:hypothetical protein